MKIHKRVEPTTRLAVCGVIFLILAGRTTAAITGSPTEFVKTTINEVFRILSDEKIKKTERLARRKQLEQVIGSRFDYEEMSKRALAAHWKKLTKAEQKEFVEVFKAFLSASYADRIEAYSGEEVRYLKERQKDGFAEVQTKIVSNKVNFPMN